MKKVAGATTTRYIFSGVKVVAEYVDGAAVGSPTREYIYSGSAAYPQWGLSWTYDPFDFAPLGFAPLDSPAVAGSLRIYATLRRDLRCASRAGTARGRSTSLLPALAGISPAGSRPQTGSTSTRSLRSRRFRTQGLRQGLRAAKPPLTEVV